MRPYVRATAFILLVTGITVVADPVHRGTTMRVAMVALVLVAFVALARFAARRLPPAATSPFDPVTVAPPRGPVPFEVHRLASDLELYQHPGSARLGSGAADRVVRGVVRDRLRRHHGVEPIDDPLDDPAATAYLGAVTTACLARRAASDPAAIDPEALVAELEAL